MRCLKKLEKSYQAITTVKDPVELSLNYPCPSPGHHRGRYNKQYLACKLELLGGRRHSTQECGMEGKRFRYTKEGLEKQRPTQKKKKSNRQNKNLT